MGSVLLMPADGHLGISVLCVTLLAVSSVAVSSMAAHLPSLIGYLAIALGPATLALLLADTAIERVVGYALLASTIALCWTGWQSNLTLRRLLQTELELVAAIDETRAAQQAAEQASEAKSRFLATMSHEVRTPLNGVLGLAELLESTPLDDQQRRHLGLLRLSGDNLRTIVDDILDFSRIEAGGMQILEKPFEPRRLVENAVALWRARAFKSGIKLRLDPPVDLPQQVRGDALRVRQVLDNLISNAIKFTPRGSVTVRLEAEVEKSEDTDVQERIRFSISDSGVGIPADAIGRVFDRFTQVDDSPSRRFGGTGLGLAICRRLVELMGGTLDAESTPGVGSTFRFSLPLKVVEAVHPETARNAAASAMPDVHDPSGCRVLVVEDNAINRAVCGAMLDQLGIEYDEACDGIEALDSCAAQGYDAILMDCQMPRMDGYEATRELRRQGAAGRNGRPVPIIALTANAFAEDRQKTRDSGMDDFLAKPISLQQLGSALERCRAQAATARTAQPPLLGAA